jgi:two-component SAPR family response regulator
MNKLTYIDYCQLDHFILKKILSRYGLPFEVKCTDSCKEVLDQLVLQRANKENLPDIIFLDIYSSEFDAWEFLDKVQLIYPVFSKPVEIYILSAAKYPADVERLKQYDLVKAFILKPITKEVLQKLMRQKELSESRFETIEGLN